MTSGEFWTSVSVATYLAVGVAVVTVLRRPREPRAMFAWILTLIFLPLVGLIVFVLIGEPRLERTRRRRRRRREALDPLLSCRLKARHEVHAERVPVVLDERRTSLATLAGAVSGQGPTCDNTVTIYHDAEATFDALRTAIEQAESHVHLEYFIFQPDATGRAFRDLLVRKRREGVECRLLVDYVGCFWWKRSFLRSFVSAGIPVGFFLPVVPWRNRWRLNFRNHRKIVVVDGVVGFTGSQNIGDEYRGRLKKYAPWRDTHMRLYGPAVHQLQEIFVEDWHYATGSDLAEDKYFPPAPEAGREVVQVIPSGPDCDARVMHHLLLSAVASARRSVAVITPYFVPDTTIVVALQSAAYRGVRVQLLIPARSNHRLALWAGRSFYQELSDAGVEIYEYPEGLLHSKVVVVDEDWAMVGSANMDERSFRINFEVTTILYDEALARCLLEDFEALRYRADRLSPLARDRWSFGESVLLGLARLTSPLL